jgi:hypothetical protein
MEPADRAPIPPRETVNDWLRFVAERRLLHEIADWLTLRAAELEWDFWDLAKALVVNVKKPQLIGLEPDEPQLQ